MTLLRKGIEYWVFADGIGTIITVAVDEFPTREEAIYEAYKIARGG